MTASHTPKQNFKDGQRFEDGGWMGKELLEGANVCDFAAVLQHSSPRETLNEHQSKGK